MAIAPVRMEEGEASLAPTAPSVRRDRPCSNRGGRGKPRPYSRVEGKCDTLTRRGQRNTGGSPCHPWAAGVSSVFEAKRSMSARKKVVVAMSGGVDSSMAAALLLREGHDVLGVFMRLGSPKGVEGQAAHGAAAESCETDGGGKSKQGCCSMLDAADARRVAGLLDIPFYVLNFQEDFGRVIDYFVDEYNRGRTPNPCVRCNDWLKFGKLAQYAEAAGADFVASGHYARAETDASTGRRRLLRGRDHRKDQSYVLFGMSRQTLDHTLLPIGTYEKHEVRAMAEEMN